MGRDDKGVRGHLMCRLHVHNIMRKTFTRTHTVSHTDNMTLDKL